MTDRTNDDWRRLLGGSGPDTEAAVADLRENVRRGLRKALAGRPGADDGFVDDVTQEAVLKVLGGLAGFRGDGRLTTWAVAVAVRVALTERRRARWKDVPLDAVLADPPAPPDPPPDPDAGDRRAAIVAVMGRVIADHLTDRQRQAITAELRGMPQAELADRLGLTRNALYELTHDARRKLKAGLEAAGVTADEVREAFDG